MYSKAAFDRMRLCQTIQFHRITRRCVYCSRVDHSVTGAAGFVHPVGHPVMQSEKFGLKVRSTGAYPVPQVNGHDRGQVAPGPLQSSIDVLSDSKAKRGVYEAGSMD